MGNERPDVKAEKTEDMSVWRDRRLGNAPEAQDAASGRLQNAWIRAKAAFMVGVHYTCHKVAKVERWRRRRWRFLRWPVYSLGALLTIGFAGVAAALALLKVYEPE